MSFPIEVTRPPRVSNRAHHLVGLGLMLANVVRHRLQGYRTPRPLPARSAAEALRYDAAVVDNWRSHLARYLRSDYPLGGKRALEIGPGPDVGTGLLLLALGLQEYRAIDVNPLVKRGADALHDELADLIATRVGIDPADLRSELQALHARTPRRLHYVTTRGLDLSGFESQSIDLVLSHAVFEHLSDVFETCRQLHRVCRPGAVFVAEVDLQTHTRWIREADPLNLYRYSDAVYGALRFPGSPNRMRPDDYVQALEQHGWHNCHLFPQRVLDPRYVERVEPSLAPRFRGDPERLGWLNMVVCATRAGDDPT